MSDDQKPLSAGEREALARELTDEQMQIAPAVEKPVAVFTAGQPGSGKSSVVNRVSVNFEVLGAPPAVIDADEVRPNIPYMQDRIAKGDLDIPEAAYGDAGTVAARMMQLAAEARRNIVYDGTLSNPHYAKVNVEFLKQNDYRVEVHGMAVVPDLSHASTYERRELQIQSSPTGFGRGVGDEFHDQAVKGLIETIGALQADGKVDAIVLYDRQGNVIGRTALENGQWVPDEQMADALRNAHQNPSGKTLQDASQSWNEASRMMRERGAEPGEQAKVDAFRDAAAARVPPPPTPAERATQFETACAAECTKIVGRASRLESKLLEKVEALRRTGQELEQGMPSARSWIPGRSAAIERWTAEVDKNHDAMTTADKRLDRITPYTQAPISGYPSKVDEAAVKKVERRDPQLAKDAAAFRLSERKQQAQTFAETRTQQQSIKNKLSR